MVKAALARADLIACLEMCSLFDLSKASAAAGGVSYRMMNLLSTDSRSKVLPNAIRSLPFALRFARGNMSYFRQSANA